MGKTDDRMKEALVRQKSELPSADADVSAFLEKARSIKPQPGSDGRLIFALDATMSRQPTWDQACHIQAEMFQEAGSIGGLNIKLVFFEDLANAGHRDGLIPAMIWLVR